MFLTGADNKTPEVRPPSIKGMMRFWWRAMHGYLDNAELKEREGKMFGTSDEDIGRSKFSIRAMHSGSLRVASYLSLPHRSAKALKFRGISPDQSIFITLTSRYYGIDECADVLKASLILGGLAKGPVEDLEVPEF